MVDFNWRANLVACYLLFPSILWPIDKLEEFHEDIVSCSELDVTDFLFFKYRPYVVRTFLYYFF